MAEYKKIIIKNEDLEIDDEQLESVSGGGGKSRFGFCPYCGQKDFVRGSNYCRSCGYGSDKAHDY